MIGIQWREQTSGHLQPLEKNSRANAHFAEYQAQLLVFSFTCDTTQTYSLLFFFFFQSSTSGIFATLSKSGAKIHNGLFRVAWRCFCLLMTSRTK